MEIGVHRHQFHAGTPSVFFFRAFWEGGFSPSKFSIFPTNNNKFCLFVECFSHFLSPQKHPHITFLGKNPGYTRRGTGRRSGTRKPVNVLLFCILSRQNVCMATTLTIRLLPNQLGTSSSVQRSLSCGDVIVITSWTPDIVNLVR